MLKLVEKDRAVFCPGQTEQPFQEAEKGNVTERGPAEDCARQFVHGISLETEKAIQGSQR